MTPVTAQESPPPEQVEHLTVPRGSKTSAKRQPSPDEARESLQPQARWRWCELHFTSLRCAALRTVWGWGLGSWISDLWRSRRCGGLQEGVKWEEKQNWA